MTFLIGPAISAGLQVGAGLLGSALGGGGSAKPFGQSVVDLNAGGLSSKSYRGQVNLSSSPERQGLVGDIQKSYGALAGEYGALRPLVAPGFSALRQARLAELNNRMTASIGNLRDNLARRKLAGSSFASDAVTRADLTFQQEADRIQAETFLQELALTQDLMQRQLTASRAQYETGLNELNLQTQVGLALQGKASDAYTQMMKTSAELDAKAAAGTGALLGYASKPLAASLAGGSLFGGSTSSSSPLTFGGLSFA